VTCDHRFIRLAIERFIALVEATDLPAVERVEAIPAASDGLAHAIHQATYTYDERDFPDAPRTDAKTIRTLVSAHFPSLGYYNLADPTTQQIGRASVIVGDGIDDIVDIYLDLKEALWRWDGTSVDDALWHLTNSFGSHWGLHLRSLQYYLHVLASGVDDMSANNRLEPQRHE